MTPIRINLLPHRQLKRARAQRALMVMSVTALVLGVGVVAFGQYWLSEAQTAQQRRNDFLRTEIAKLDKQIAEISQIKEKTLGLLAKKDVVESLQNNRSESVRLFSELASRVPEGLYLKSVKQNDAALVISGYAQSSARVSTLMRALEESEVFQNSVLVEVKGAQVGGTRVNEFTLNVGIERAAKDKDAAATPQGGKT